MSASKYTPDLGAMICARMSGGESVTSICKEEGMPCKATVMNWLVKHPEFQELYTAAGKNRAEALVEEMLDVARNVDEDPQRSRLKIDVFKWQASKLLPKKYGERLDMNLHAKVEEALPFDIYKLAPSVRDDVLRAMEAEDASREADEG